jgi:RNA polymerase sigma factor (sigma-70 family)
VNQSTGVSDLALIQAIAAGQTAALDELYTRYGGPIYSFLMARLGDPGQAEEVLQDVIMSVWRSAVGFRGDSKVLTWLLTIARNRAINLQRKRKLDVVPLFDEVDAPLGETGPLEKVVRQSEHAAVREALLKLPEKQREVLVLVFYHQLSEAEVSQVLDIPPGTVKSRLHRGKERLRRVLVQSEV